MGETSVGEARKRKLREAHIIKLLQETLSSPQRPITVLLTVLKEGFLEDRSDVGACSNQTAFPQKILKKKV